MAKASAHKSAPHKSAPSRITAALVHAHPVMPGGGLGTSMPGSFSPGSQPPLASSGGFGQDIAGMMARGPQPPPTGGPVNLSRFGRPSVPLIANKTKKGK